VPSLSHYVRTVSHLKIRQIAYQLIRRFCPRSKALLITRSVAPRQGMALTQPLNLRMQGKKNNFTFLNVTKRFDKAGFDWSSPEMGKLWRYNLHYFGYLNEKGRPWQSKAFLIDDWLKNNPQGTPDAWEPFPVSLRIVNWVKFFLSLEASGKVADGWLKNLCEQVLWLERNIEYHLLANHYFKNGKALTFAGLFFAGEDAARWLKKGLVILGEELNEQILDDGGHFERSPMYHSMILEDCLDLLNLMNGCEKTEIEVVRGRLAEVTAKMSRFLAVMCHPDGGIALFNDAAFGIEALPSDLIAYYERLTGRSLQRPDDRFMSLPASGYFILSPASGDRLFIDCGPIGPDYQPGHAHCDTLSFELSLKGRRVIVDSGCFEYEDGSIRQYNRGNAGHNTLTIDGRNQSEVWGAHRCARRARPLYANLNKEPDGTLVFEGAHDGYHRLSGSPIHHRRISWSGDICLIEDRVEGKGHHEIESRLHIHPSLSVDFTDGVANILDDDEVLVTVSLNGKGEILKNQGWYCPEFGIKKPCVVLTSIHKNASLPFEGGWNLEIHNKN